MGDGVVIFMCSRGSNRKKCAQCRTRPATKKCDYPLHGAKIGQTCDRDLCDTCARVVGKDRHYCRVHAVAVFTP